MDRIAIVGCSGGGKSTLARALGAALDLPVVHLDALFWKPGWVESDREAFRLAVERAAAADRWVIDGNFTTASALRFARADLILWIQLPMWLCLWRAFWRAARAFGEVRPDLAPGCPEKIDFAFYGYIWSWNRATAPKMRAAIEAHGASPRLMVLRSDREIGSFARRAAARPLSLR
jgi:adenylate kinase family enzyme